MKNLKSRINEYIEKNKTDSAGSLTPVIGANGNWWIGDTDTGCPVTVEGQPGMSAYAVAVANGFQGTEVEWLNSLQGTNGADGKDGVDGAPGKDGVDGQTPFIGENGNWWIGETDTGYAATTTSGSASQTKLYRHSMEFSVYADFSTYKAIGTFSATIYTTNYADEFNFDSFSEFLINGSEESDADFFVAVTGYMNMIMNGQVTTYLAANICFSQRGQSFCVKCYYNSGEYVSPVYYTNLTASLITIHDAVKAV